MIIYEKAIIGLRKKGKIDQERSYQRNGNGKKEREKKREISLITYEKANIGMMDAKGNSFCK